MNKLIYGTAILVCALVWFASSLSAASIYTLSTPDGEPYAVLTGDIRWGDAKQLDRFLDANPHLDTIMMASPGGVAAEAYEIGRVLSYYNMKAFVAEGTWCLSACATAFLGASEYKIDGVLGFHTAWANPYTLGNDQNEILRQGQSLGAQNTIYLLQNGFSAQFAWLTNSITSPTDFLVFFHEDDLMKFYARTENDETDPILPYFTTGLTANELDQTWLDYHRMDTTKMLKYMGFIE